MYVLQMMMNLLSSHFQFFILSSGLLPILFTSRLQQHLTTTTPSLISQQLAYIQCSITYYIHFTTLQQSWAPIYMAIVQVRWSLEVEPEHRQNMQACICNFRISWHGCLHIYMYYFTTIIAAIAPLTFPKCKSKWCNSTAASSRLVGSKLGLLDFYIPESRHYSTVV